MRRRACTEYAVGHVETLVIVLAGLQKSDGGSRQYQQELWSWVLDGQALHLLRSRYATRQLFLQASVPSVPLLAVETLP